MGLNVLVLLRGEPVIAPETTGGSERGKIEDGVCVRACFHLFFFHRLRHSEAGVRGRLSIRKMKDDRYLNLSTCVLPDLIPDDVALLELGAQSETRAGWILTQFHSRLIFHFHYSNWRRCQTNRKKCANLVRTENSTHTLHHHILRQHMHQVCCFITRPDIMLLLLKDSVVWFHFMLDRLIKQQLTN